MFWTRRRNLNDEAFALPRQQQQQQQYYVIGLRHDTGQDASSYVLTRARRKCCVVYARSHRLFLRYPFEIEYDTFA